MSGIVRGFASESEMIHVRETQLNCPEDVALLGVRSIANDTRKIPVAVVPLDDATLAACVEKARDAYRVQWHTEFDATDGDIDEAARLRIWLVAVRAAIGLGGEGA